MFPAICLLTLDGNNVKGDDAKVEGTMMATRLLGNFGRYGAQPFRISYKMGDDDNNDDGNKNNNNNNNSNDNDDDDDIDDDDNNAEEADGMPMTIVWPTTPSRAATLMAN